MKTCGTKWRWVVNLTLRPLYSREKIRRYPLDRRLGGPQSQYGRGSDEKKPFFFSSGNRIPAIQHVAYSLYRLSNQIVSELASVGWLFIFVN
jgi:hypothetical protein